MVRAIAKWSVVTVLVSFNSSGFAAEEKLREASPAELALTCESLKSQTAELVAKLKSERLDPKHAIFDCEREIVKTYEAFCNQVDCSKNVVLGVIFWIKNMGGEVNLRIPFTQRELEPSVFLGVNVLMTQEMGTGRNGLRAGFVVQPYINLPVARRSRAQVAGANGQMAVVTDEGNAVQKLEGGFTLIFASRGDLDRISANDLFTSVWQGENFRTLRGALNSVLRTQISASGEFRDSSQSDLNHKSATVYSAATNIMGLASAMDIFNWSQTPVGNAGFFSRYKLNGVIRSESARIGWGGIIEINMINKNGRKISGPDGYSPQ